PAWDDLGFWILGSSGQTLGDQFTPAGDFWLSELNLVLSYRTLPNEIIAQLRENNAGLPGAILETWDIVGQMTPVPAVVTVSSVAHPFLQSGKTYWVVLVPPSSTSFGVW